MAEHPYPELPEMNRYYLGDEGMVPDAKGPFVRYDDAVSYADQAREQARTEIEGLRADLVRKGESLFPSQNLSERLKLEAQIHAQEARTANSTIAEIYQLVTGATGEPGNWHGAEPVRKLIAAAPDLLSALQAIVKSLADQDDEGMIEHAQQMIDARAAIAKATGAAPGAALKGAGG